VSVFLLLLAFFILLNSLSTVQSHRAGAVRHSVETAFGLIVPPAPRPDAAEALAGAARMVESLGDLFVSEIPVAKIEATGKRGRTLVVTLPVRTLFVGDESVRPETLGLLTRVADALTSTAGGAEIRLEFLVATADSPGDGDDLTGLRRAAAFGAALAEAGAPASRVTVGLEKGEDGWARLLFTVADAPASAMATPEGRQP
jgi:hypothetical protein